MGYRSMSLRQPVRALRRSLSSMSAVKMDEISNLCKKRGFIFQSSELYSPLSGFFDYGPLGVEMKNNIKRLWWRDMVQRRDDMVGVDCSIISSSSIWKASGHIAGFSDPMVDCKQSKLRYRADQVFWGELLTEDGQSVCHVSLVECGNLQEEGLKLALKKAKALGIRGPFRPLVLQDLMHATPDDLLLIPSPATGVAGHLTAPRNFNLMFQTSVGAVADDSSIAYLRPETAQGIFVNFASIQRSSRHKIPFGIAQIGKAFRNEITPRNFIFRSREFEQMEIEYFIPPDETVWQEFHQNWINNSYKWLLSLGLPSSALHLQVHENDKLAHYAKACTDITFDFPFGNSELMGIAARGSYDLQQHSTASGKSLEYHDPVTNVKYIPHVIEPSIGIDRLFLALLSSSYQEEMVENEKRVLLKLSPSLAPVKVSVLPLVNNKPEIMGFAKDVLQKIKRKYVAEFDTSGAIGRRYRRADEIGTPFCVTVDYDSLVDNTVTLRYRDSMKQDRVSIDELFRILRLEIDQDDY